MELSLQDVAGELLYCCWGQDPDSISVFHPGSDPVAVLQDAFHPPAKLHWLQEVI